MAAKPARHGSEAGYKQELATGNICTRCRNAHREYNRQFKADGKAEGLKYARSDVIDHLARPPRPGFPGTAKDAKGQYRRVPQAPAGRAPAAPPQGTPEPSYAGTGDSGRPSVADRLAAALRGAPGDAEEAYVEEAEIPDYLRGDSVEYDPEPSGEWSEVTQEEFVLNAAGMAKIEDNLGFYLSVVGLTVEMIDPYCGPVLANNMDNIVKRWAKVIAHYPAAVNLFMDGKGGTLFAWIGAIQATWPFLYALYEHHLSRNVRVHNGRIERRDENNPTGYVDSTTPPMPNYDYSVG